MRGAGSAVALALVAIATVAGLNILAPQASSVPTVPYDRALYKHWIDADRDCQDARQEVLIAESVVPVTLDPRGCRVLRGEWHDPYTGSVFTDPAKLDVDHMVPLAEAHVSGGSSWSPQRRQDYANNLTDPNTLIAVSLSANRAKGDKDPAKWLPANAAFRCAYVQEWVEVKERWNLSMDAAERLKVDQLQAECGAVALSSVPFPRLRPTPENAAAGVIGWLRARVGEATTAASFAPAEIRPR
jgi:hypothetical protein